MRHFTFHVGDWTAAVAHLSDLEEVVYLRLTLAYYREERPLPVGLAECCEIARARTPKAREAVAKVLRAFFDATPDGHVHTRCDKEIADMQRKSGGAKSAANLRWEREREARRQAEKQTGADANAMRTQCERSTDLMPPITHYPLPIEPSPHCSTVSSLRSETFGNASTLPAGAKRPRRPAAAPGAREAKSAPVWRAYAEAYIARYSVEPVRNAKVNADLSRLVDLLGPEAEHVADWYVRSSNRGLYLSARHDTTLLVRDAAGLRTEWATGAKMTDTLARQADRTATTGNVFEALKTEARNGTRG